MSAFSKRARALVLLPASRRRAGVSGLPTLIGTTVRAHPWRRDARMPPRAGLTVVALERASGPFLMAGLGIACSVPVLWSEPAAVLGMVMGVTAALAPLWAGLGVHGLSQVGGVLSTPPFGLGTGDLLLAALLARGGDQLSVGTSVTVLPRAVTTVSLAVTAAAAYPLLRRSCLRASLADPERLTSAELEPA